MSIAYFDNLHLVGLMIRPAWLNTLSLAAELHGAENNFVAIGCKLAKSRSLNTSSVIWCDLV